MKFSFQIQFLINCLSTKRLLIIVEAKNETLTLDYFHFFF